MSFLKWLSKQNVMFPYEMILFGLGKSKYCMWHDMDVAPDTMGSDSNQMQKTV